MKTLTSPNPVLLTLGCGAALLLQGCGAPGLKYRATDGRTVNIGLPTAANGGQEYKTPHLDGCWIADGFNFNGYDTVYVAPVESTAKFNENEVMPHGEAQKNLVRQLAGSLEDTGLFKEVVMKEPESSPGTRRLKLENTIVEYAKGGGAARYWAGLYGAGQPRLRVEGKLMDGDKAVFTYKAFRSGTSAGARMGGAFMKDVDIQLEDIRSMVLDLTDFIKAIAGKYEPLN